ncbi:MAG TPA: hypothetical protein VK920_07650 [Solirubrobacterales bacterium]|nr:hypothetical protein [Solirubrobacterales bacterium]
MSRTPNKIIAMLVAVLAAAALAPAASAGSTNPGERSQTELGQAVGDPAEQGSAATNARYSRTPTELGQQVATSVAPDAEPSGGFGWGDAAIGASAMLALIGFAGAVAVVFVNRRRHAIRDSRVPAVSN